MDFGYPFQDANFFIFWISADNKSALHICFALVTRLYGKGCHHDYIGKTGRTLWERINEHGYRDKGSVIYNHITNCKDVSYLVDLLKINNDSAEREKFDRKIFSVNIVKENTCII